MRIRVSQEEMAKELGNRPLPTAFRTGMTQLPLVELGARDFERLIFLLLKEEISEGRYPEYTDIQLMQGIGERGRDCLLYNNGRVVGVVQCKKHQDRLSKPDVLKELTKFAMHSVLDRQLMPEVDEAFDYHLYVAHDFSENAMALIQSYSEEIDREIRSSHISTRVDQLVKAYKSFNHFGQAPPLEDIFKALKRLRLRSSNATDLTFRINQQPKIMQTFFRVEPVISIEDNVRAVSSVFTDLAENYGFKLLTDDDLKVLQQRISNIEQARRINLGIVDIYGYPPEFLTKNRKDLFVNVIEPLSDIKMTLSRLFIDFIVQEIKYDVQKKITGDLLLSGKVHPFTVQLAVPYLIKLNLQKVAQQGFPKDVYSKLNPDSTKSPDDIMNEVIEILLASVRNGLEAQSRIKTNKPSYFGFDSVENAKSRLESDIPMLRSVLHEISAHIDSLMPENPTVVLKDAAFLTNKEELERVKRSLSILDG